MRLFVHYMWITCFLCKSVWIPCQLVGTPILFYTWPCMLFICTHFRNVRRKCHTIRNFTFDLHTATTRSERHVSVCLHALIVQMFCRIYCRTLCRILFPHIARSHTFSKDEYERHCDPQAISKKISVQQPQPRKHTFQEDLCTTYPGDI